MIRARLIANESFRWFRAETPVCRRAIIRPCGLMNFLRVATSL